MTAADAVGQCDCSFRADRAAVGVGRGELHDDGPRRRRRLGARRGEDLDLKGGIADVYALFARSENAPGRPWPVGLHGPGRRAWPAHRERLDAIAPHPLATLRFDGARIPKAVDGFDYPERIKVGVELTDAIVAGGIGDRTALIGNGRRRTYKDLSDWTNRLAHAMVDDLGVRPGNRVQIHSANNPAMVACWLAATKASAVVVNAMPLLHAAELGQIVDKAEIEFALCNMRLMDELAICAKTSTRLKKAVGFGGT